MTANAGTIAHGGGVRDDNWVFKTAYDELWDLMLWVFNTNY